MMEFPISPELRQELSGDEAAMKLQALFQEHHARLQRLVRIRLDSRLRGRVRSATVLERAFLRMRHELARNSSNSDSPDQEATVQQPVGVAGFCSGRVMKSISPLENCYTPVPCLPCSSPMTKNGWQQPAPADMSASGTWPPERESPATSNTRQRFGLFSSVRTPSESFREVRTAPRVSGTWPVDELSRRLWFTAIGSGLSTSLPTAPMSSPERSFRTGTTRETRSITKEKSACGTWQRGNSWFRSGNSHEGSPASSSVPTTP